jgi:hypothetical protein
MSKIPRRIRLDKFTPAEKAIWDAVQEVEKAGCDILLTDAVNLLQKAREKVADFVDREEVKEEKPFGYTYTAKMFKENDM